VVVLRSYRLLGYINPTLVVLTNPEGPENLQSVINEGFLSLEC